MKTEGWPTEGAKFVVQFEWMCPCANNNLEKFILTENSQGKRQILCVFCEKKWNVQLIFKEIK